VTNCTKTHWFKGLWVLKKNRLNLVLVFLGDGRRHEIENSLSRYHSKFRIISSRDVPVGAPALTGAQAARAEIENLDRSTTDFFVILTSRQ
jgi:hypothetical protein